MYNSQSIDDMKGYLSEIEDRAIEMLECVELNCEAFKANNGSSRNLEILIKKFDDAFNNTVDHCVIFLEKIENIEQVMNYDDESLDYPVIDFTEEYKQLCNLVEKFAKAFFELMDNFGLYQYNTLTLGFIVVGKG